MRLFGNLSNITPFAQGVAAGSSVKSLEVECEIATGINAGPVGFILVSSWHGCK